MGTKSPHQASEGKNILKSFGSLFEWVLDNQGETVPVIEYALPYPKTDFLKFLTAKKNVLLHGSSNRDLEIIEPRQANDSQKVSGNKKAVYGVIDPILPIFYAIQDRNKIQGVIQSGVEEDIETGKLEYKFRIPKSALDMKPWTRGVVYILDRGQFSLEKYDIDQTSGEWTSEASVKPLAKLEVGPEDFPFLDNIEGLE